MGGAMRGLALGSEGGERGWTVRGHPGPTAKPKVSWGTRQGLGTTDSPLMEDARSSRAPPSLWWNPSAFLWGERGVTTQCTEQTYIGPFQASIQQKHPDAYSEPGPVLGPRRENNEREDPTVEQVTVWSWKRGMNTTSYEGAAGETESHSWIFHPPRSVRVGERPVRGHAPRGAQGRHHQSIPTRRGCTMRLTTAPPGNSHPPFQILSLVQPNHLVLYIGQLRHKEAGRLRKDHTGTCLLPGLRVWGI